jgi:hypothetical protein
MNIIRSMHVVSAALLCGHLGACGPGMHVSVVNATERPVRLALIDVIGSHESTWLMTDIAVDTKFEYQMTNGWRSDGKYVRISDVDGIGETVTMRIPESGDTKLRVHTRGKRFIVERR